MRVFNLTDVETPELKKLGLVNVPLVVGRHVISPGDSVEAAEDETTRQHASHFVSVGAVAVDSVPPTYTLKKARK